jgi:DNA-binding response OmpR family regulator
VLRGETVRIGHLVIDVAGRRATLDGQPVVLSQMQFNLLAHLAQRAGQVVTYDALLEAVWGCPSGCGTRDAVKSCVKRLRRKLDEDAQYPEYIVNVRGVGYRLRSQEEWEQSAGVAEAHGRDP